MFGTYASILSHWPNEPIPLQASLTACHERLRRVLLEAINTPEKVGPGDLAGLIGHILRRQAVREGQDTRIKVPKLPNWPDEAMWRAFGLDVEFQGLDWFRIRSQPWDPDWLNESTERPPLDDTFAERQRRPDVTVLADPFIQVELGTKFSRYTCPGQRMAVRTAILAKEGAVIIVNLPTGTGKSLVAWVLGMARRHLPGLTLVVVPTTALALDQERQMADFFKGQLATPLLAWHSGLSNDDRATIRQRIREGTQPVLFTSPESVVASLAPTLYAAAETGLLQNLIIDEAHLVSQWGAEFRPEFQAMAGMAADLRKTCPTGARLKTVLMTATLTSEAFLALKTLYSQDTSPLLVSEARLRPEPAYFCIYAENELDRTARIMELIHRVPRPFILYVTRPKDTLPWLNRIRELGIRRVDTLHGKSTSEAKIRVVDAWRNNELDAVVATSAFGLGMDKNDVRTVLHACVPETIDRFYQEVGRGGRDGKACVSFTVFTNADLNMAKGMSRKRVIGIEKGFARWRAMYTGRETIGGEADLFRVDLNSRPFHVRGDSDGNKAWNLRTLVLMARTGLISLESEQPPRINSSADRYDCSESDAWSNSMLKYFSSRVVRAMTGHLDNDAWRERAEVVRSQIRRTDEQSFVFMEDVLWGRREISKTLCDIYQIPEAGVEVSPSCGGCHICRQQGQKETAATGCFIEAPSLNLPDVDQVLRHALGQEVSLLPVVYSRPGNSRHEQRTWRRHLYRILNRLVCHGITEIAADDAWLKEEDYQILYRTSPNNFLLHTSLPESSIPTRELALARVTMLGPDPVKATTLSQIFQAVRPLHLVLLPDDTPSPVVAHKLLVDIHQHCTMQQLLEKLEL